jgi:hypothetical protein
MCAQFGPDPIEQPGHLCLGQALGVLVPMRRETCIILEQALICLGRVGTGVYLHGGFSCPFDDGPFGCRIETCSDAAGDGAQCRDRVSCHVGIVQPRRRALFGAAQMVMKRRQHHAVKAGEVAARRYDLLFPSLVSRERIVALKSGGIRSSASSSEDAPV